MSDTTPSILSTGVSVETTPAPQQQQQQEQPIYDLSSFESHNNPMILKEKRKSYIVQDMDDKSKHFNIEETAKRFKHLLGLTGLFKHFITSKAEKDDRFKKVLDILNNDEEEDSKKRRKTEKEEDAELLQDEEDEGEGGEEVFEFKESPKYINGKLRPYQIAGLNWLISLKENNLSGILADEMGLGKTLQTISFLGYLRYLKNIPGPHLVIVPKSTLDNWQREFNKWTPEIETVILTGDQQQRNSIIESTLKTCEFDVLISSYEIVIREKSILKKFKWEYIIVDEAHRLKNEDSLLSQIIRTFHSNNRLLITGTPLQNNLHELWALLNFLLPDIFSDSETFDEWFSGSNTNGDGDGDGDKDDSIVQQLHKVLQPFLIRRIKSEVEKSLLPKQELNLYVSMSEMQKKWYQKLLEKDIDAINGGPNGGGKKESKTRLLNIVMQLRKCCNHPYLFEGAEPGPPFTTDEHLIFNSQKMKVLDKLLKRLQKQGSRVLIFSQMSRMLDILEDYCIFREFEYCRIDGQTDHIDRIKSIDEYNAPNSKKFIFLLTTRAGGLGINLTTADTVFLYDSDWNPQADLQAMDRAHRIGQTKQVRVFRFITQNAIEEKVLERASQKLRLDQLVIQQGRNGGGDTNKKLGNSKQELLNMIQYGAADLLMDKNTKEEEKTELDDDEIDSILKESELKTKQLNEKYSSLGLDDLQNFTTSSESVYEWDGKNFQQKKGNENGQLGNLIQWINPTKRERKENYSIDGYYRDVLNTGGRPPTNPNSQQQKGPKLPKQMVIYDHQFYPLELYELFELERNYYKKLSDIKSDSKDKLNQQLEQFEIDNSRKLTEDEELRKQELINEGFGNWTRRDFYHFIQMNAKYGRNSITLISNEFEDKSIEEIKKYSKKFWSNYSNIEGYERYLAQIETGEEKIRKLKIQKEAIRRKLSETNQPLLQIPLKFPPSTTSRRVFTEEEDRYLILQCFRIGLDNLELYDLIKDEIKNSPLFEFDYFFQSRTTQEISRRCSVLIGCILKEYEGELERKRGKHGNGKTVKRVKK
ncbi:hypothetical protein CANARDRAFT_202812 [[Candida] arabinofermentans NRRL YB-2248]|uniref:Chromatin remodelling complex ATPase chain ISW1 n=1 Tax=[Candida] arabinofermentans NRRL YB-2248 TaxID=983967 RepID=A0A1E4SVN3_9ASCO|nr:hypothetical protein CANARDRAFT_202812 [[Candida] arabinofermentans NRRL YB-2248]